MTTETVTSVEMTLQLTGKIHEKLQCNVKVIIHSSICSTEQPHSVNNHLIITILIEKYQI